MKRLSTLLFITIVFSQQQIELPMKFSGVRYSPAIYKPDTTRANENVLAWGGFGIVDVDDFHGDIKEIEKKYEQYQFDAINLYKIYVLEKLTDSYDNILYLDLDILNKRTITF